ncbi:MAG: gliding motility-associated C-terminal domain-containing protein [Cytophagales bacterium]|nr:gliding motility-associated C-terminal domain-containing protein [Cytophagales bacterium]
MSIKQYLFVLILFAGTKLYSQAPDWQVVPANYQYSMSMVIFSKINHQEVEEEQSLVAAFVGDECRGVANFTYSERADRYLAFLTVYSNTIGDSLNFRVYRASGEGQGISEIERSFSFNDGLIIGQARQPISISEPPLNTEAELLSFSVPEQVKTPLIENDTVFIELDSVLDRTSLVPGFVLSEGASAYLQDTLLISNESEINLEEGQNLEVWSESGEQIRTYYLNPVMVDVNLNNFEASNLISPNNDGYNDTWIIKNVEKYQDCQLKIFDLSGKEYFKTDNYQNDWDGTANGEKVPVGTYYFLIEHDSLSFRASGYIQVIY